MVLCICLTACAGTASEVSSEPTDTESTSSESSGTDNSYVYWTDYTAQIEELETLSHKPSLTDDEIRRLASLLSDKAWYLCYLAYKEVPSDTGYLYVEGETDAGEIVEQDGKRYIPVQLLPYRSTEEMSDDIYAAFEETPAVAQHFGFVSTLYKNIDDQLCCYIDADGQSQGRIWQVEDAVTESVSADRIVLKMPVEFMDSVNTCSLEIVMCDGVWKLNESYFAEMQG